MNYDNAKDLYHELLAGYILRNMPGDLLLTLFFPRQFLAEFKRYRLAYLSYFNITLPQREIGES